MLCKSDKPFIIIIIMSVGGMGFIPERLLMMMMMMIYAYTGLLDTEYRNAEYEIRSGFLDKYGDLRNVA